MLALDHHGPSHPGNLVGKCDGGASIGYFTLSTEYSLVMISDP